MIQNTLKHRTMGAEGLAKISSKEVPDVIGKLDMKGFVQTELDANFFNLLGLRPGSQIAGRGVRGYNPRQRKGNGTQPHQHEDKPYQTFQYVTEH
jgi:hypothetical protein